MRLTRLAVQNWQVMLVALLLLISLGLSALLTITRSVDPVVPFPVTIVTVTLPGADAVSVEGSVSDPIEAALQGLEQVREVRSLSADGLARVVVEFEYGADPQRSFDQAVREVESIRDSLPGGIGRIEFKRPRPSEAAVLQLALVNEGASSQRLIKYSNDLRDKLSVIPGVREAALHGAPSPEVRVEIESERLAAIDVPALAVANAIVEAGEDLPIGAVSSESRRYNVTSGGDYRSLEAIGTVPLRSRDGALLSVKDIANLDWVDAEYTHRARYNGKPAVFLTIKQQDDADAIRLVRTVIASIDEFRSVLPPDIRVEVGFDQSSDIQHRLSELLRDFLIAMFLVVFTVLPLGFRPSLIVVFAIPLSLAIGVFLLASAGFTLNQLSIAGFILALGLLVDDSIVVVESIGRSVRSGLSPVEAAITGTERVTSAVIGATVILILAFVPLASLPETAGEFIRSLPVAVMTTVGGSMVVALTVIPFAACKLLKPEREANRLLRGINSGIGRLYGPILKIALDRPVRWFTGAMILCASTFALVPSIGFSLFPAADVPYFLVKVKTPQGSSLELTDRAVRDVSRIIAQEPLVEFRMENVGRGNPQVYYNATRIEEGANYGDILVTLEEWDSTEVPQLLQRLRADLAQYPLAQVSVINFENGPPIEAPIAVRVSGPDLDELKRLAGQIEGEFRDVDGLRDIRNPIAFDRVDIDLGLDETKAGLLGIAPSDVRRAVRLSINGEIVGRLRDAEGDSWPVRVIPKVDGSAAVSALDNIYVSSETNATVPLSAVADPQLESEIAEINRWGRERSVTLTAYTDPGVLTSRATAEVLDRVEQITLPPGYEIRLGGEAEAASRNFAGLGPAALFAIFGILAALIIQFRRFRETLVVVGVIPLGIFGGLMALWLTGNSLSFVAMIGFIALIGIEIKNSILLIDMSSQLRGEGIALREAIERASEVRFLPVLITAVTAIGGLLPLAIGGSALYAPLAIVIIGGLVSSTVLSRIIIPVMYLLAVRDTSKAA